MMKERNLYNENLLTALYLCPRESYQLAVNLGVALDANRVYEGVCTRPDQTQAAKSKRGIVEKHANIVVGIVSALQRKTGRPIIKNYMNSIEEKIEFIFDLDDFFNELYSAEKYKG